jgi:hypothetical protein
LTMVTYARQIRRPSPDTWPVSSDPRSNPIDCRYDCCIHSKERCQYFRRLHSGFAKPTSNYERQFTSSNSPSLYQHRSARPQLICANQDQYTLALGGSRR